MTMTLQELLARLAKAIPALKNVSLEGLDTEADGPLPVEVDIKALLTQVDNALSGVIRDLTMERNTHGELKATLTKAKSDGLFISEVEKEEIDELRTNKEVYESAKNDNSDKVSRDFMQGELTKQRTRIEGEFTPKMEAIKKREVNLLESIRRMTVGTSLTAAVAGEGLSPVSQVVQLLLGQVSAVEVEGADGIANFRVVVVDDSGNPRRNPETGENIGVKELVKEFADASPHFVPSKLTGGSGTKGDEGDSRTTPRSKEGQRKQIEGRIKELRELSQTKGMSPQQNLEFTQLHTRLHEVSVAP